MQDAPIEIDSDTVQLLLVTLAGRLEPFAVTAARDTRNAATMNSAGGPAAAATASSSSAAENGALAGKGDGDGAIEEGSREQFAARYRNGQRRVLEESVAALEGMLAQMEAESSSGSSSESETGGSRHRTLS